MSTSRGTWRPRAARVFGKAMPSVMRLRADRDAIARERDRLAAEVDQLTGALESSRTPTTNELYPPGHFYSPIPDRDAVKADEHRVFRERGALAGIDLRTNEQVTMFESLTEQWSDWPYYRPSDSVRRYRPDNDYFGHMDGLVLGAMLRKFRPQRYIEVGSGWSSALVLDTRERLPECDLECVFIEPYPERLYSLLSADDRRSVQVIARPIQDVDSALFDTLRAGDMLFIDSSHVSKVASDVNMLIFDVMPRLPAGVWVHVHDIGYPFEYPREWIYEGRAWNEAYLLRAMLMDSARWQIALWCDYLQAKHASAVERALPPEALADGMSIWLLRT
jgi:hypothetical protein